MAARRGTTRWASGRRAPGVLLLLVPLLLVVSLLPSAGAQAPPLAGRGHRGGSPALPGAPGVEGLRFEHHVTYDVAPAELVVRVRHEATVTNTAPDRPAPGGIRYTYFPELRFAVPAGATNVAASKAAGGSLAARIEPSGSPLVEIAIVDLSPDLRYGDTQSIVLTYDLPPLAPRSESVVRVNAAFVTFPILLDGDPGATTVEVRVPEPFTVEVVGDDLTEQAEPGMTVLRAEPADPPAFFASIVARNDGALLSREVDLGDHDVVVRGWPDDAAWVEHTATRVRDGVPRLADAIGLPWPATGTIDVLETAAPYLYGYAGWYQPADAVIAVGDQLDQHVVLHELAHLWFNAGLFLDRWINEGLAEVFAAAVGRDLGGTPGDPPPLDPAAPGAVRLNDWETPDLEEEIAQEREAYGYGAAWAVMDQIADEVGLDALAEVVRAAQAREVAYGGPGLEGVRGAFAWTQLLDLLELRAGSALAGPLFEQHVVGPDEAGRLSERAAARARYTDLEASGGSWIPPVAVRLDMANWSFSSATSGMDLSAGVLDVRDRMADALVGTGAEPVDLEAAYEEGEDLDEVVEEADEALAAAGALQEGAAAADRSVGPLGTVGLLLTAPDDRMAAAVDAFEEGRYGAATREAEAAVDLVEGAERAGLQRVAVFALLLVAAIVLLVRRRRRGRPVPEPAPAGQEEDDSSAFAPPGGPPSV